jgi:Helix-turn-helix domain
MSQVVLPNPFESLYEALESVVREAVQNALAAQRQAEPSPWLDVDGAARHLSSTPAAIRSLKKRGEIPFHQAPNGRLYFDRHELDAWVRGEAL